MVPSAGRPSREASSSPSRGAADDAGAAVTRPRRGKLIDVGGAGPDQRERRDVHLFDATESMPPDWAIDLAGSNPSVAVTRCWPLDA